MYRMVFTQVFYWLKAISIVLLAYLFVSCGSYRAFHVEVLEAADAPIKSGKRIGFLDRDVHYAADTVFFLYRVKGIKRHELPQYFYYGLIDGLREGAGVDSVVLMTGRKPFYLNNNQTVEPISQQEISRICNALGVDYIVALENLYYSSNFQTQNLFINYAIRLYSGDGSLSDSLVFNEDITGVMSEEYDIAEIISQYTLSCGNIYAQRLVPHWENVARRVYNKGRVLRVGDVALQNNNPEDALRVWQAAGAKSPKRAVQAAINSAWVYENAGDFSGAVELLNGAKAEAEKHGIRNADTRYLDEYMAILKSRVEAQQRISLQLSE